MRRVCALITTIALAGGLAAPAMAADPVKTLTKRVTALERQLRAVKTELGEAEARLAAAETEVACLGGAVAVAQYGVPPNEGYLYGRGTMFGFTTGLDEVEDFTGMTPGTDFVYLSIVEPGCIVQSTSRARLRAVPSGLGSKLFTRFVW